jgi:polysaccharide deacetylase 2 family uncharacterized protein YibQ
VRRWLAVLVFSLLALPAASQSPLRIAIIIDDLGNSLYLGQRAIEIPGALTYSVLPQLPYSQVIAERAHQQGKEVMLHLPMQTTDGRPLGPGGLHTALGREDFAHQIRASLASVPHASGVNNHMGSLLTQDSAAMQRLMQELKCFDDLYFVDSRTDMRTVARRYAREAGLANGERDIFLDNQQDPAYVRVQLRRLIARARERGSAIGIGHPYPGTLAVLADEVPRLAAQGIQLVPVSELVENQRSPNLWHAFSSPLPPVAKNLKQ